MFICGDHVNKIPCHLSRKVALQHQHSQQYRWMFDKADDLGMRRVFNLALDRGNFARGYRLVLAGFQLPDRQELVQRMQEGAARMPASVTAANPDRMKAVSLAITCIGEEIKALSDLIIRVDEAVDRQQPLRVQATRLRQRVQVKVFRASRVGRATRAASPRPNPAAPTSKPGFEALSKRTPPELESPSDGSAGDGHRHRLHRGLPGAMVLAINAPPDSSSGGGSGRPAPCGRPRGHRRLDRGSRELVALRLGRKDDLAHEQRLEHGDQPSTPTHSRRHGSPGSVDAPAPPGPGRPHLHHFGPAVVVGHGDRSDMCVQQTFQNALVALRKSGVGIVHERLSTLYTLLRRRLPQHLDSINEYAGRIRTVLDRASGSS